MHFPTKHLCILVSAPYFHHFSAVMQIMSFFGAIWDKFALNLVLDAEIEPSNGTIWNEFSK